MKSKIEELENEFKKVVEIDFFPTENYEKGPSAITFNIVNENTKSKIGKLLNEIGDEYDLLLHKANGKLNVSFILIGENEILNLNEIEYDAKSFDDFITVETGNRKFVLGIGYFDATSPKFKIQNFDDLVMINSYKQQ